jgi:hypothetical protein
MTHVMPVTSTQLVRQMHHITSRSIILFESEIFNRNASIIRTIAETTPAQAHGIEKYILCPHVAAFRSLEH